MKRLFSVPPALALCAAIAWTAAAQPPEGGRDKKGGREKGPPPFELGKVIPPHLRNGLQLTAEQEKQLDALEKNVRERLEKILTKDQQRQLQERRPGGPGEGKDKGGPPREQPVARPRRPAGDDPKPPTGLVANPQFHPTADGRTPAGFTLSGAALYADFAAMQKEVAGCGVRLLSGKNDQHDGSVSYTVAALPSTGRWFRLRIRGLAQENFRVENDALYLKVEFFKDGGRNQLDHITKSIYAQVERDRASLADAGTNRKLGPTTWRHFDLEFRTPFPEIDSLRLSAGFANGAGSGERSEFWINEFELVPIAVPADYQPPTRAAGSPPALDSVVKLGGRWYYDPRGGERKPPAQFDSTNADRLLYLSDRLEAPFADNTTAWLRKGFYDIDGVLVTQDRFVPDNVILTMTDKHLIMRTKGLPNHPTAVFPDRSRALEGNPNIICEQDATYRIPLEPRVNSRHIAMDSKNTNRALPMGPIGVAVNGVVFFNPFDAGNDEAVWRLDRCCGHPGPDSTYHYHKYPVCMKSMWADDGTGHSPVIGFALDGFPVYGPYESAGVLAKDAKDLPLNEFNLHDDPLRGPHYHVTPGKYPHIIGGYWGTAENRRGR